MGTGTLKGRERQEKSASSLRPFSKKGGNPFSNNPRAAMLKVCRNMGDPSRRFERIRPLSLEKKRKAANGKSHLRQAVIGQGKGGCLGGRGQALPKKKRYPRRTTKLRRCLRRGGGKESSVRSSGGVVCQGSASRRKRRDNREKGRDPRSQLREGGGEATKTRLPPAEGEIRRRSWGGGGREEGGGRRSMQQRKMTLFSPDQIEVIDKKGVTKKEARLSSRRREKEGKAQAPLLIWREEISPFKYERRLRIDFAKTHQRGRLRGMRRDGKVTSRKRLLDVRGDRCRSRGR